MSTSLANKKMSKVVEENPFYKMSAMLNLMQQGPKLADTSTQQQVYAYLDGAWKECNNKEKKELFFSLVFSLGDISNRQHNIFRRQGIKEPQQGGQSKRRVFMFCLKWMIEKTPQQFYTFLPIIGEYYNLDGMMMYELRTDRWKGTLKETLRLPIDVATVTTHIAKVLKSSTITDNEMTLWARWLPHVPSSNRIRKYTINEKNIKAFKKGGHDVEVGGTVVVKKEKKPHTKDKDSWVIGFITILSNKMDWKIVTKGNQHHFEGYRAFRKKYLSETEAALFSSKRICGLDKTQFWAWLDKQPSGARYRVACRVVLKDKSGNLSPRDKWVLDSGENMGKLYMDWIASKQVAQTKLASLTPTEIKEMKPQELRDLAKAAKVNTGGDTMIDLIAEVASKRLGTSEMDVKAFSLLEKVKMDVPVLVCVDKSGSMASLSLNHKGFSFSANSMCQLAATMFLLKNPDEDAGQFFIRFGTSADVIVSGQQAAAQGVNKFMGKHQKVVGTLVDRTRPFSENLYTVSQYITSGDGGTDLSLVPKTLKAWVDETEEFKSQKIEQINKYPVILCISDGDLNNYNTAGRSFMEFQQNMRQWFGWEGVVVMWDVKMEASGDGQKYDGINNLMYFGGMNPAILNQIFLNINDLDIIDSYLPLKAMHQSNRYEPVRKLVL